MLFHLEPLGAQWTILFETTGHLILLALLLKRAYLIPNYMDTTTYFVLVIQIDTQL